MMPPQQNLWATVEELQNHERCSTNCLFERFSLRTPSVHL